LYNALTANKRLTLRS